VDLREVMLEVVDWIHVAQNRDQWWALEKTVMNLRVAQKAENFFTISFSGKTLLCGVG
jgi:hypothetical protein